MQQFDYPSIKDLKRGPWWITQLITCLEVEITKCGKERIITDDKQAYGWNYESRKR
jgi:hypothetical protein